jgi:hypothetical protein
MKAPEGNSGAFARSDPQVRSRRDKTATIDDRRGCVARASQRMVRTRKGARLAGPDLRGRARLHLRSRRLGPGLRDRSGTLTLQFLRQLLPARIGDDFDRSFAQHRRNRGAAVFGNALESFDHGGQRRICPGSMSNIYGRNPYRIASRRATVSTVGTVTGTMLKLHHLVSMLSLLAPPGATMRRRVIPGLSSDSLKFNFPKNLCATSRCYIESLPTKRAAFSFQTGGPVPTKRAALSY